MTEVHPQVARALALHPLIQRDGDEINRRRELTQPIVQALKDGGFFRMLQPRSIGGMEMKPSDFSRVTEAIATADGSERRAPSGGPMRRQIGSTAFSSVASVYSFGRSTRSSSPASAASERPWATVWRSTSASSGR